MQSELTRPIVGIENRTAQEVFDIMCDRFKIALSAAEPHPATSVAVKALEWRDEPIPPSGETLASSVVGLYCIPHSGDRFYLRFRDATTLGDYSTLDKAKAAAQADYEARILSALSAQVQDVAETEAIAALKEAEPYVEICHSLMTQKETRANVWRVLKQVRAAIAAAPAKQEGGKSNPVHNQSVENGESGDE